MNNELEFATSIRHSKNIYIFPNIIQTSNKTTQLSSILKKENVLHSFQSCK